MDPREFVQRNVIDPNKGEAPYALTRYDDRWYRYRVNPEEAMQGLHQQLSRIDQALRDPNTPPVTRQSLHARKIQLMGAGKVTRYQAGMGGGASTQDLTNYYSQYIDPSKANMVRTQQASSSHPRFTRLADHGYGMGRGPSNMDEFIAEEPTPVLLATIRKIDAILSQHDDAALEVARHRIENVLQTRHEPIQQVASMDVYARADGILESLMALIDPRRARIRARLEGIQKAPTMDPTPQRSVLDILEEKLETPTRLDPASRMQLPVQVRDQHSV